MPFIKLDKELTIINNNQNNQQTIFNYDIPENITIKELTSITILRKNESDLTENKPKLQVKENTHIDIHKGPNPRDGTIKYTYLIN